MVKITLDPLQYNHGTLDVFAKNAVKHDISQQKIVAPRVKNFKKAEFEVLNNK